MKMKIHSSSAMVRVLGISKTTVSPSPNPFPRPLLTTRQAENQSEQSEFPEAFHRRPEPIAASKKAHGFYHPAMAKPTLKPLPAKPIAAQTGENILKPRYISTTNIPIEPPTTQPPKTASKKPVSPKTAVSMQVAALAKKAALSRAAPSPKAAAPLKVVPPPMSGTGLPPKPPVPINRFPEEDSNRSAPRVPGTSVVKPESSTPFPHTFSIRMATSGDDKPENKEPQQSIETPTLPLITNLRPRDEPQPENKSDPKPDQASTRSTQKRKRGDTSSAAELKIIWALCFEHRQAHDVSRLGHFALPIPSHSLHLVSPVQLDRAKRYVIPDIIRFEVTPLQLDGEASPIDPVRAELFALDLAQHATPAYYKLQLRPSTNQTDGLAWPVLRSMQIAWELTARWYKEVIVDGGWAELGRMDREDTVMPDAMDMDGDENENDKNDKNDKTTSHHDKITGMGLGDFVASELKKTVTKTKHRRDEPKGSVDIDDEISSWLSHLWREQN